MSVSSSTSKAINHSTIYAVGNILRQLTGFLMLPVYTSYLTPADYGVVGLLIFTISLIEIFFGARLVHAVPKFYHDSTDTRFKNAVVSTALLLTLAISLFFTVVLVGFSNEVANAVLGENRHGEVLALFSVLLVTQAVEYYGMTFLRIQERPVAFVLVSLLKLAAQLGLNIWFIVWLEMGVLGVALSSAISSTVFAMAMMLYTLYHTGVVFSKEIAVKQIIFCWPLWVAALAGIYIGSANRFFIRIFSSLDDIGLYELAVKFSSIMLLLIWEPFQQYWTVERFAIYRRNDASEAFRTVFRFVVFLLAIVGVGVSVFSRTIIQMMSDESFHPAFSAVPLLVGAAFFSCLASYCEFSFLIKEKTSIISQNTYITAAVITVFYVLFIPYFGYVGAALALMVAYVVMFAVTYIRGRQFFDMRLDFGFVFWTMLISVLAVVAFIKTDLHDRSYWIQIAAYSGIYLVFLLFYGAVYARDPSSRRLVMSYAGVLLEKFVRK